MNDSFVFYRSFYEAVKKLDDVTKAHCLEMICEYALNGEVKEVDDAVANALFIAFKPQIDANTKRRENGKKGGAPEGNNNAKKQSEDPSKNVKKTTKKQPSVEFENNQKQPNVNVNDIGYYSRTNVLENNQEKKEEINIISSQKKADFLEVFEDFKAELLSESCQLWRDTVTQKFGVKNYAVALEDFKTHIVTQGKEQAIINQTLNDFKAYFANSARLGFLTDKALEEPPKIKPKPKRECVFYTQRTGDGIIGVIKQDGVTYHVPMETGYPPTPNHFWNPQARKYELQAT